MRAKSIIGVLSVFCCLQGCASNEVVSNGDRTGIVTKLSNKKMYLCGGHWNWEGELALPGGTVAANQNDGAPTPIWQFSLPPKGDNDELVARLKAAMNNGHTVRITYSQINSHDCSTETDYLITGVWDIAK